MCGLKVIIRYHQKTTLVLDHLLIMVFPFSLLHQFVTLANNVIDGLNLSLWPDGFLNDV